MPPKGAKGTKRKAEKSPVAKGKRAKANTAAEKGDGGRIRKPSPGVPGPRVKELLPSRAEIAASAVMSEIYMRWAEKKEQSAPPVNDKSARALSVWISRECMERPTMEDFPNPLHTEMVEQGLVVGFIREIVRERTGQLRDGFRKHGAYNVEHPVLLVPLIETENCAPFAELFEKDTPRFWRQVVAYCRANQLEGTTPSYYGSTEEKLDDKLPWKDFRLGIIDGANRHYLCFDPDFDFPQVRCFRWNVPFMLLMYMCCCARQLTANFVCPSTSIQELVCTCFATLLSATVIT